MDVCCGQKPSLANLTSAGEGYNRFDKKKGGGKPGRPFFIGCHCFKISDSVCEGVAAIVLPVTIRFL